MPLFETENANLPTLGAIYDERETSFRIWAPEAKEPKLILLGDVENIVPLESTNDGYWQTRVPGVRPGDRYRYRLARGDFPDPASRWQPVGVHGPSAVVDPHAFRWSDHHWQGVSADQLVFYELHIGTFSPQGTFAGAREKLPYLVELGVTAIELMPVAAFPGKRNWGYDGVDLFAPAQCYGTPDDLRRLIDAAHGRGLAVFLDVVYNHLGPDGNYLAEFSPHYFHQDRSTPWGPCLNLDGPHGASVRRFFRENALHWIREYHFDGLRLDATHAIPDDGETPLVAELTELIQKSTAERKVYVVAEDHRNLNTMLSPRAEGGWNLDGVWADDFHHAVRVATAKDDEGYFRDFDGSMRELAETLNRGWLYCGQPRRRDGRTRGTNPDRIPLPKFVYCLQNHDQIGNRAFGDRLHHTIDEATYRACSTLLLTAPATPLLFMGQEWSAGTPFQFFTDHAGELAQKVVEGRRREFQQFRQFSDDEKCRRIPDPQADATFEASRLRWNELALPSHEHSWHLYRELLQLRRVDPVFRRRERASFSARPLQESGVLLRYESREYDLWIAISLSHDGEFAADGLAASPESEPLRWQLVMTTEDAPFVAESQPPRLDLTAAAPRIVFRRPSAVILRGWK